MARAPDARVHKAYELYKQGMKLVEIASQLNLPDGTVRRWKSTYKWDNERSEKKSERSHKKKGGQPNNRNAVGNSGGAAPKQNKNAEKFGFFSKYLPEETKEIFDAISEADPLNLLWHQIQLAYTAIVRAQSIMHVSNKDDLSKELKREKRSSGEKSSSWEEEYELQFAWDKQANFMQAQARQQATLNSLIKQYDEMLHKNWDIATEEQRVRIERLKADTTRLKGEDDNKELEKLDEVLNNIKGVV